MPKKIIGIHGLANKPPREALEHAWKEAIGEGLRVNCGMTDADIDFRLVYWADLMYSNQLHTNELFSFDDLFNHEPYRAADPRDLKEYKTSWLDRAREGASDIAGTTVDMLKRDFGMDTLADWALGRLLKDLAFYYDASVQIGNRADPPRPNRARKVLMDELKDALVEEKANEIMLIAHSMGSIIAYDVLRDLGQTREGIEVPHFVTIGAPLGLPHVKTKIIEERAYDPKVRTPSIVTRSWINYADRKDVVAVDSHLADDYGPNRLEVAVSDDLVLNDYKRPGDKKSNHHKSYGYLRTPEFSRQLAAFLEG